MKTGTRKVFALLTALSLGVSARLNAAPTVNGLFYGDGDETQYQLYSKLSQV